MTVTDSVVQGLHQFDERSLPRTRHWSSFAWRISLAYLTVSVVWILGSDRFVAWLVPDGAAASAVQSYKGLGFVLITTVLLFLVVRWHADRSRRYQRELEQAWDETLLGWALAMDAREAQMAQHSQRVADMAVALARELGVSPADLRPIYRGALLHDIGKLGVPESVLSSPATLSDEEWRLIRQHPDNGRRMLEPIEFLRPSIVIPYCHHERWDGGGYPQGLMGEDIPYWARIFSVVDVYDALTNERPYKSARTHDEAVAIIRADSGTAFDPAVVAGFNRMMFSSGD